MSISNELKQECCAFLNPTLEKSWNNPSRFEQSNPR